ncbi:hypothetical protein F441_15299 [Phytophthora nicotianae CJ01A1]|uniref:Uncharacterized protein n=4 Tax=Phytophthora nicotianae TaxID=4792 RepID=V9EI79_PHYNI|nr:hypothetical protein F443_15473 [Phytophthora nicotianae P1569]ETK79082.1 hypothetical protein L915_15032 [Phytophthora nicotianae]ETP08785.1 hypothetical protein F441_15299 [Phytophthora nicotianae CJ01A1]
MSESSGTQQELTPRQKDYVVVHSTVMTVMNAYRADNATKFEVRTSIIVVHSQGFEKKYAERARVSAEIKFMAAEDKTFNH